MIDPSSPKERNMIQKRLFDPPTRKWHQPIARLLWLANCEAGTWQDHDKYGFYRLKTRLLEQHATEDGVDWQEITHHCNACDGTGTWGHWRRDGGDFCYKCNGTGVYRRFYVRLQRYRFGGHVFHIPGGRLDRTEFEALIPEGGGATVLKGKILHSKTGRKAAWAYATLLLAFDQKAFLQLTKRKTHSVLRSIRRRLPTRCHNCGKILWTPGMVAGRGQGTAWCKTCSDDIPF
jgi:hypothetical protein